MPEIQKLKETLSEALSEGILSHAVLIEGPKGTGKRDLILWLAEAILCPKEAPPCGNCAVCRKVRDGNHPDVETILPEKDSIGIGSIRSLKESLFLAPSEAQQKVYLIPNAEKMTVEAQNALLKSLEEPPSYARFLLKIRTISLTPSEAASRSILWRRRAGKHVPPSFKSSCRSFLPRTPIFSPLPFRAITAPEKKFWKTNGFLW